MSQVVESPTSFVWEYVGSGSLLKHLKENQHSLEDQIEMASQVNIHVNVY